MSDLRECPFCGASGMANIHFISEVGGNLGQIICGRCHGRTGGDLQTFEQAVAEWNNRSDKVVALPSASDNKQSESLLCPKCGATTRIALSWDKKSAHCFSCDHLWEV